MNNNSYEVSSRLINSRVSLIVPCYNTERFIERFISSLVSQTYKGLEIIFVNDGSTDGTGPLLYAALPRLESEGYRVILIEQENKGLGGAVDAGLKHFTGEFLTWPDPDDWLTPNSIERRVTIFRREPEIAVLRSNASLYMEECGRYDGYFLPLDLPPSRPTGLFEDLLFMRSFFAPICHMVRSEHFLEVHPSRSIYFSKFSSQNFQLLIPLLERYPVLQVHEPLANYCIRNDSRSRAARTHEQFMHRFEQLLDLTEHTLPQLKSYIPEALEVIRNFHWRQRMLPTAFRGAMLERAADLISRSRLGPVRRFIALYLLTFRCNGKFVAFDVRTGRILSRAMARVFDRVVRMPVSECRWAGIPIGNRL